MTREEFEQLVVEELPHAVAPKFQAAIENVALLIEDEPDEATRRKEGLSEHETLLGLYRGVPATARGDLYGVGATLPDTITLYQIPVEEEAYELRMQQARAEGETLPSGPERALEALAGEAAYQQCLRKVIRETIWHEVAHHFGFDEAHVRAREDERDRDK